MATDLQQFMPVIMQASKMYGIPEGLLERQIMAESGGNPHAVSPVGALGIMQLMPHTAKSMGVTNPLDPVQNIMGGAKYLAQMYQHFGNWRLALAAYNAGPGAVSQAGGMPPIGETQAYVAKILGGGLPSAGSAPQESPTAAASPAGLGPSAPAPLQTANQQAAATIPNATTVANLGGGGSIAGHIASMEQNQLAPLSYDKGLGLRAQSPSGVQLSGGMSIVQAASGYLGVPYKWGGTNPSTGMDCSGFLQNVFKNVGIKIPRTTYEQVKVGQPVSLRDLQPGDAIFTEPGHAGPNHVGLYIGNGMVQESPHTGDVNRIVPLKNYLAGGFVAARRYTGMTQKKGKK